MPKNNGPLQALLEKLGTAEPKETTSGKVQIDAELASWLLANSHKEKVGTVKAEDGTETDEFSDIHQRGSSDATVKRYQLEMMNGTWRISTMKIGFVVGSSNYTILNGKHRLNALVAANKEAKEGESYDFPFMVELHPCKDDAELYHLAVVEDTGKNRTDKDISRIAGVHRRLELTPEDVDRLRAAINVLFSGFTKTGGGPRVKMSFGIMEAAQSDWLPHYKAYMDAIKVAEGEEVSGSDEHRKLLAKALLTANVVALGMVTLRSKQEEASNFWHQVATTRDASSHNIKALGFYIAKKSAEMRLPTIGWVVARAWNAFLNDVQLDKETLTTIPAIKGLKENLVPLFIDGTPYNGMNLHYYFPGAELTAYEYKTTGDKVYPTSEWSKDKVGARPGEAEVIKRLIELKVMKAPKPTKEKSVKATLAGLKKVVALAGAEKKRRGRPKKA